jgi:hypothetical protein
MATLASPNQRCGFYFQGPGQTDDAGVAPDVCAALPWLAKEETEARGCAMWRAVPPRPAPGRVCVFSIIASVSPCDQILHMPWSDGRGGKWPMSCRPRPASQTRKHAIRARRLSCGPSVGEEKALLPHRGRRGARPLPRPHRKGLGRKRRRGQRRVAATGCLSILWPELMANEPCRMLQGDVVGRRRGRKSALMTSSDQCSWPRA